QVSARLLNRHPPIRLLARAQGILVLMTLCALLSTLLGWIDLPLLMLCLMGFMASQGFVGPNAAALALAEQGPRLGVASALMGALQMNRPGFTRRSRFSKNADSRILPVNDHRHGCDAASGCRTSRCNRRYQPGPAPGWRRRDDESVRV